MRARYLTLALVGLLATRAACNVQISTVRFTPMSSEMEWILGQYTN